MRINSEIQTINGEQWVVSAVGESLYIVVKNDKVVRSIMACGAREARTLLKPVKGESLFIKVGGN